MTPTTQTILDVANDVWRRVLVVTAYRDELDHKENVARNRQLAAGLRRAGLGFWAVIGTWEEGSTEPEEEFFVAHSSAKMSWTSLLPELFERCDLQSAAFREFGRSQFQVGPLNHQMIVGCPKSLASMGLLYSTMRRRFERFAICRVESVGGFAAALIRQTKVAV